MPHWFRRTRWFYRPTSFPGVALSVLCLIFIVHTFIVVDSFSRSVTDTFYGVFPYAVCALVVLGWIASRTSGSHQG